ncbi:unnamed protein product [Closterium sp. NIES-53]
MEVARTSMIHAASPHFLWPFAVRYAPHQLNLWPRVSLPETSPTLRWTGEVGDASVSRVWGSRAFVCDTSADKLSARAIPCVFLGFVPDAPGWQFYHPTSHRVLPSQDVTFDESVPFYRLFPYHSAPPPPPPLSLAPDPLLGTAPVEVAVGSGAARGAASGGAASGGAEPGSSGSEGAGSGGAEPGGPAGASPRLSPQQLGEWLIRRAHLWSGATRAGDIGDAGAGGAGVTAGAGGTGEPRVAGAGGSCAGGARAGGAGIGGTGAGGAGAAGAGAVDPRAGVAAAVTFSLPTACSFSLHCIVSSLTERRKPASRPVKPVRTARRVPRSRPPPVPGMHAMALRPSSAPLRVPLPAPPASSLLEVPDPASDCARTAVIDPSFESAAASALVAELLDFAASCRLDYATAVVAESASPSPLSVGGECALGTDVLEDR